MENATAIILFSYEEPAPTSEKIGRAYDYLDEKLKALGAQPTYYSNAGFRKMRKYGGAFHKRGLANELTPDPGGMLGFGLSSNPPGSDEPAYDRTAFVDYIYMHSRSETMVYVYLEDQYLKDPSPELDKLLVDLSSLQSWDFGQAMTWPLERDPANHLAGGGGHGDPELRRRQDKWYATYQPSERVTRVRDVYPYNMLNARQLAYPVGGATTLRDFIMSNPFSELRALTPELELWTVQPEQTELVRSMLTGTGVLITE